MGRATNNTQTGTEGRSIGLEKAGFKIWALG